MSRLCTPPPEKALYTDDDLCAAARKLGCGDVKPRTIRTFVELGLLDHPCRGWHGRGGGSTQGEWSRQQFGLWCTLLRQRKQLRTRYGDKAGLHIALCVVVVGGWLYLGDASGVPLSQVRRAMQTWAKAHVRVGFTEARQQAMQLIRTTAHPSATNLLEQRKSLTEMIYTGIFPSRDDLLYQMEMLVDPHGRGTYKGPAEAPISAENLTDIALGRSEMLRRLSDSHTNALPDGQWEWARYVLLLTRGWYQAAQPRLADDPSLHNNPELASMYNPETFETMINAACGDLLQTLSLAKLAKQAAHLPPEQRPDPWLAGQLQLKITAREELSQLLLPDGSRQGFLGLSIQLIRTADAQ